VSDTRTLGQRYRFSPSNVNDLINKIAQDEKNAGSIVIEKNMQINKSSGSYQQTVTYFLIEKTIEKETEKKLIKLALFPVSKDSNTANNQIDLPFIGDLIKQFREENNAEDYLLLMPMRQCRGFLTLPVNFPFLSKWVQKRHIVLTKVNFADSQIIVHDPQVEFKQIKKFAGIFNLEFYPDKATFLWQSA